MSAKRAASVALATLACLLLIACGAPRPQKKPPPRDEFKASVMGKTKGEVTGLLGKPESTRPGLGGNGDFWSYPGASYDPVAARADRSVTISFDRAGKVVDVYFIP